MSNIKITELPEASSIDNNDLLLVVDSGNPYITKKINWKNLSNSLPEGSGINIDSNGIHADVTEAPNDSITYGRRNKTWVDLTSPANLQIRRGTASEVSGIVPLEGEPIWATDSQTLYIGDGSTSGGIPSSRFPINFARASGIPGQNAAYYAAKIFVSDGIENSGFFLTDAGDTSIGSRLPNPPINLRGHGSVDFQSSRIAPFGGNISPQFTSGDYSSILGGRQNTTNAKFSSILNGKSCIVATGCDQSVILNGNGNVITGSNSLAFNASATASSTIALLGNASAERAVAINGTADRNSMYARAGGGITNFSASIRGQEVSFIMRGMTTTSIPTTELTLGGTSNSKLTIVNNTVLSGTIEIIGFRYNVDPTNIYHVIRKFTITNYGNTTTMKESPTTVGTDYITDVGLDAVISADDTGDFLKVQVTGLSSIIMRWVAIIRGIEVAITGTA